MAAKMKPALRVSSSELGQRFHEHLNDKRGLNAHIGAKGLKE